MVDGELCDGGATDPQGWFALPRGADDPMRHVATDGPDAAVGPAAVGIESLVAYGRYLRTFEMLGAWRAGVKAGPPAAAV